MSKDTVYFELLEFMNEDVCPVCALIEKRVKNSMDSFLFECVNDPAVRKTINSSGGLCDYHSEMLLQMGDPLAHAIIYHGLIENALKNIKKDNFEQYRSHSDCKYCKMVGEFEEMYTKAFVAGFAKEDFAKKYTNGGMLCMAHLDMIKELCGKKRRKSSVYAQILDVTKNKYNVLLEQLSEIQRKSDYRFTHEKWIEDEIKAWKRAVGVINDKTGKR